jgi:hypothetical protein
MKYLAVLFLLLATRSIAEQVTLSKAAILKGDRTMVSLKAGTVVELITRAEGVLTVRYNKVTGAIPIDCVATAPTPVAKSPGSPNDEPKPAPPRKAETAYGKAVEKARENAGKHEKNLVKPADEVTDK